MFLYLSIGILYVYAYTIYECKQVACIYYLCIYILYMCAYKYTHTTSLQSCLCVYIQHTWVFLFHLCILFFLGH